MWCCVCLRLREHYVFGAQVTDDPEKRRMAGSTGFSLTAGGGATRLAYPVGQQKLPMRLSGINFKP